jgi:hypothetical protein
MNTQPSSHQSLDGNGGDLTNRLFDARNARLYARSEICPVEPADEDVAGHTNPAVAERGDEADRDKVVPATMASGNSSRAPNSFPARSPVSMSNALITGGSTVNPKILRVRCKSAMPFLPGRGHIVRAGQRDRPDSVFS